MQKRFAVQPHLSLEEIEQQDCKAKDPVARSHWQIIWLLAQGKSFKQIVEYIGYGLSWIRTIAHRYNEEGPDADGATAAMAIRCPSHLVT
jgi:Homeodomain-like domain